MPIDSQVEVKQVRLVKGTGAQIAAARQASEILETDLVVQTDAPDLVTANTAITGATKCKITYDSKGLVTAGADLASGDITTALGYTPYDASNPSGYITGITSSDVTTALGYTPYDASNPNGYTSNVGTVTSVNNVNPVNGNVTLSIPSEVTETTVSNWGFTKNIGTVTSVNNVSPTDGNVALSIPTVNNSTISFTQGGVSKGSFTLNQSSGATIALDAGGGSSYTAGTGINITNDVISVTSPTLTNTGSNTNSLAIGKSNISTWTGDIIITTPDSSFSGSSCGGAISIGKNASHSSTSYNSVSIGFSSSVSGNKAIALGGDSNASANFAIQLGQGTNSEANSFYVGTSSSNNWKLLGSDGKVPYGRLPIATSVSSSSTNEDVVGAKLFYDTCGDIETLINAL